MADVLTRISEGCDPDPFLLWDSVWSPIDGGADWRIAVSEPLNRGGLQARKALFTGVTLALFSDARLPDNHPLSYLADGDPRGWWGNGVDVRDDLGEAELGSLLWLLERAPLTVNGQSIAFWARQFAIDALMPLQNQGAFVRMDVQADVDEIDNRLELAVQLYGIDGTQVFNRKFDLIWRQLVDADVSLSDDDDDGSSAFLAAAT